MDECIFCKISKKETPAEIEYEDDDLIAFKDINPKAPVHILIVPKKHIKSVAEIEEQDTNLPGKMIILAKKIAEKNNLQDGYRLIFNVGKNSGQIVDHIHLHLLGGRPLGNMS